MEKVIMERLNCSATEATEIVADLSELHDELKPVLSAWINNDYVDYGKEYEGYSLNSLIQDYRMQFTGAILTADWLIKDPKAATQALRYGIR